MHDAFIMPGGLLHESWAIRYGLSVPMFAVVLPLMWTRLYVRWHRAARLFFAFTISAVVLSLGAIATGEPAALQTSWAPLFLVLGPFIARFDVVSELAYAVVTLLLYNVLTLALGHGDFVVAASINMAIVSMGIIGVLVARQMERQAREVFIQGRTIQAQMEALDAEKQKSEALLLNVLPGPIAERLKLENRPIADGFQDVSVLFADIVGFTKLSERLSPEALVGRLNQLFSAFDDLLDRFKLEKIKTIGDAYMVVGGLNGGKDHALALAELAPRHARPHRGAAVRAARGLQRAHRHQHRARRRRRHRQEEVHLRRVGGHGEHREPHGVDGLARRGAGLARDVPAASSTCTCSRTRGEIEVKGKRPG